MMAVESLGSRWDSSGFCAAFSQDERTSEAAIRDLKGKYKGKRGGVTLMALTPYLKATVESSLTHQ